MFQLPVPEFQAMLRLRLAPDDARYSGGLVPGSKAMEIFADLETELALREGGDEGLCAAYHGVEFLAPLRVGDFVHGVAWVESRGRRSERRLMQDQDIRSRNTGKERRDSAQSLVRPRLGLICGRIGDGLPRCFRKRVCNNDHARCTEERRAADRHGDLIQRSFLGIEGGGIGGIRICLPRDTAGRCLREKSIGAEHEVNHRGVT